MSPPLGLPPRRNDEEVVDPWPHFRSNEQRLDYLRQTQEQLVSEVARLSSESKTNTLEVHRVGGLVANQTKVILEQFQKLNERLDAEMLENAEKFGQVAKNLAGLESKVIAESEARQKQDSLHEDEITGVKHKALSAEEKAHGAHEKAEKAQGALEKVRAEISLLNVAKGVFLGVVVKVISFLMDHLGKGFGG